MAISYAAPGSGPSAGGIGWFEFGSFTINPGETITGLTGTLTNGITVTFDLTLASLGGVPRTFNAVPAPVNGTAYFGSAGYTGLAGNVVLYSGVGTANNLSSLTLSNIVVKDAQGNILPNYTVVMADGESTSGIPNFEEGLSFTTDGGDWTFLAALGNTNPPTVIGSGQFIGFIGVSEPPNTAFVYTTQSPTTVTANLEEALPNTAQGIAIGFAVTQLQLYKNVAGRLNPTDQFQIGIAGTPAASATTAGAATGLQSQFVSIAAIPGNTYTLDELMAPGSASAITDYSQTVSAVNLTPGGTIPATGALPLTFTPALGDIVQYTILNAAKEVFTKTVDKAYAQPGDVLTYTVTVRNPNNLAINNVLITDPTPAGTTYQGNLIVSVPFTGTDPASGITLTTIAAASTATLSWQVQVQDASPSPNPIANVATVTIPGGNSGTTNPATTQINFADLTTAGNFVKTVSPANAQPGDTVTYTVSVTNTGNVAANNVVITDPLPAGTTYVANSVTGTLPFTGTPNTAITLTTPLAAGANAIFTFQAVVSNTIPSTNPITNTASINYAYTVNPAAPNGVTGAGNSNIASLEISSANLTTKKTVSKTIAYIGDIITFNIAITNSGNVPANNVVITDPVPTGTAYVANSLTANVPFTGTPASTIQLTNPIPAGATVALSFQVKVTGIPNPSPIRNIATVAFAFTVDPQEPNGVTAISVSNATETAVFQNNYTQQINDLVESVALEEAALAAILNAEGAKIQKFITLEGVTPDMMLCLNKSVTEMTDTIAILESILKQKLSAVDCQINGNCMM